MAAKPFTIVVDTREQTPFDFGDHPVVRGTLDAGDYSILNMTDLVAIERKSLSDLVGCVGRERERFERELHRLKAYRYAAVVIEATRKQVAAGKWRGEIKPACVLGSIASWRVKTGVDFVYAGDAAAGAEETLTLLRKFRDYCEGFARRFT